MMTSELIEAMARAMRDDICRQEPGLMTWKDGSEDVRQLMRGQARAALAAAEAAGYRLVPVEPTRYMEREGARAAHLSMPEAADVYCAMLAAALDHVTDANKKEVGRD